MKLTLHFKVKQVTTYCYLIMAALLCSFSVLAQQTVTGKVSDNAGNPLSGASVSVKGSPTRGTITNEIGVFSIVASEGETIEITMTEYEPVTIQVGDRTSLDIILKAKSGTLSEVIMIGYGNIRRKDAVGAISKVPGENFGNSSAIVPAELLQGRVPGVQVIRQKGLPGAGVGIIIRGTGTFTNTDPLFIIDGIKSTIELFNVLSPQDIESITILKDASSTAIYGANGANGVVIITTKKGRMGPPRVTFSTQWGIAMRPKKLSVLDVADYYELAEEYADSNGDPLPPDFPGPDAATVDWQDQVFRNAMLSSNHVSLSGGSDKILYNLSLGYMDQEAIVHDFRYRVANMRFVLEESFGRFNFGQSVNIQYQHTTGNEASIENALLMPPYMPVYDPNKLGGFAAVDDKIDMTGVRNPIARVLSQTSVNRYLIANPQFFGEIKILHSLKFRSQLSLKFSSRNRSNFQRPFISKNDDVEAAESIEESRTAFSYVLENFANWDKRYGPHHFTLTAGNSYTDKGRYSRVAITGTNIANNSIQNSSVALTNTVDRHTVGYENPCEISYFGRLNYDYKNKYVVSASFRRDGSSIFGPSHKFGNFPAMGLAWNVINEDFLRNIKNLNDLKIRFSYGKTGNSHGAPFQYEQYLFSGNPAGNVGYGINENFVPGLTINRFPNPDVKWEETTETNIGLDLATLNNSLTFTIDWYNRKNADLLVDFPIANSSGTIQIIGSGTADGVVLTNAATMKNTGIEFQVNYKKSISSNLSYNIALNGAFNKNRVLSLGKDFPGAVLGSLDDGDEFFTITQPGMPISSYYGYLVDHVLVDDADVDKYRHINHLTDELEEGDFIFKDTNGDGIIDEDDKVILGNPMPKFLYGGTIEVKFRNFDFNLVMSGAAGLKLYNGRNKSFRATEYLHNVSIDLLDRWTPTNTDTKYPNTFAHAIHYNLLPSDFYIEDGSFCKIKIFTIGYNLSPRALNKMGKGVIKNFRIYVTGENLITFTGYSGYDPELGLVNQSYIFTRGVERFDLPQPRSFVAGIQMSF